MFHAVQFIVSGSSDLSKYLQMASEEQVSNSMISYRKMSWSALVSHLELAFFVCSLRKL